MADAVTRALRAESGSILAFLPGQGEIRRALGAAEGTHRRSVDHACSPLRRDGHEGAGLGAQASAQGAAQGRARDLDCRDIDHHRGRARRHRQRSRAGSALRAGRRRDAARNCARVPCRRRSAKGARRPHRTWRLLPAVGRAANAEPPRFRRARNSLGRSFRLAARLRRMGNGRSAFAVLARSAARRRHRRRARGTDGAGSARPARPHHGHGKAVEVAAIAATACPYGNFRSRAWPRGGGSGDRRRHGGARAWRQRCRSRTPAGGASVATARAAPARCESWRPAGRGRQVQDKSLGRGLRKPPSPCPSPQGRGDARTVLFPWREAAACSLSPWGEGWGEGVFA